MSSQGSPEPVLESCDRREFGKLALGLGAAATVGGCAATVGGLPRYEKPYWADWTIARLGDAFRDGSLSPLEVTSETIRMIEATQSSINAYAFVDREGALKAARFSEERFKSACQAGPLDGIPVAFKDQFQVAGMPRNYGNALRKDDLWPSVDEMVVARFREAGCVFLGKTAQCDEGALSLSVSSANGITRNPRVLDNHAGGSSSGSGAAAAAGLGPIQMGADQGGSIREPAGHCGCFGFKPSVGFIPRDSEFGVYGPITRFVEDLRPIVEVAAGAPMPKADIALDSLRIAYMPVLGDCLDPIPAVRIACDKAVARLESAGAMVTRIGEVIPDGLLIDFAAPFYYQQAVELKQEFGAQRLASAMPACFANHFNRTARNDVHDIDRWGRRGRAKLDQALEAHPVHSFDIILAPTSPTPSFPIDRCWPIEAEASEDFPTWIKRYGVTQEHAMMTVVGTYMKTPEITFPCPVDTGEEPIGISAIAKRGNDAMLLEFAETVTGILTKS